MQWPAHLNLLQTCRLHVSHAERPKDSSDSEQLGVTPLPFSPIGKQKIMNKIEIKIEKLERKIEEAEAERKNAKEKLERMPEGRPTSRWEKLLDSATQALAGLRQELHDLRQEKLKLIERQTALEKEAPLSVLEEKFATATQELHDLRQEKLKLIEERRDLEISRQADAGLKELIPLVREQTQQNEAILPFLQDFMMNIFDLVPTSDRTTNQDIKIASINYYTGSNQQKLPRRITCQLLSLDFPSKFITCSHIFQKRWKSNRSLIGLADIHDSRNTLLLLKPLEILFDEGQLIFLWNQASQLFEMKIMNPGIRKISLQSLFTTQFPNDAVPASILDVLIGDLENRPLNTGQNSPFKRCLAFHASVSRYEAIKRSMWITSDLFPPIPCDAWSPGIAEQPKLRSYLEAWIDSVNMV